jgi:hypothetical protein
MPAALESARLSCDLVAVQLHCKQVSSYVAVNEDALPNGPADAAGLHQVIPPAKTSTGFSREFSSAISGFRSLCGQKQRSSGAIALAWTLRFGTFHPGAGSRFENSGLHPQYPFWVYGASNPGPML